MSNTNTPLIHKGQDKDTDSYQYQYSRVREAFNVKPATMLMIAAATGIERANICRYLAAMRKRNEIALIRSGLCEVSKHRAGYYTTDKALFPATPNQLKLF